MQAGNVRERCEIAAKFARDSSLKVGQLLVQVIFEILYMEDVAESWGFNYGGS